MSTCDIAAWWTTAGWTLSNVVWLSSNGAADWSFKWRLQGSISNQICASCQLHVVISGQTWRVRLSWLVLCLLCTLVAFEWHWILGTVLLQLEDKVKEKMEDGLVDLYGINTDKNGGNSKLTNAWDDIQQTVGWTLSNMSLQCWRSRSEILSAGGKLLFLRAAKKSTPEIHSETVSC